MGCVMVDAAGFLSALSLLGVASAVLKIGYGLGVVFASQLVCSLFLFWGGCLVVGCLLCG